MKKHSSESIVRYFSTFFRMGATHFSKEYKALSIGSGQYQFLIQLYLQNGISHDKLTELMNVDKATTTRAIDKLEKSGFVEKKQDEHDKRKFKLYLTPYALSQKAHILSIAHRWEEQLSSNLTLEEKEQLLLLLRKMAVGKIAYPFEKEENIDE
ncbi:MAG: MarR family winged helix-turn-helix transcriptional regulator [Bacillaceae bacterium]